MANRKKVASAENKEKMQGVLSCGRLARTETNSEAHLEQKWAVERIRRG